MSWADSPLHEYLPLYDTESTELAMIRNQDQYYSFPHLSWVARDFVTEVKKNQKYVIKSRHIHTHKEWSLFLISNVRSLTTGIHQCTLVITSSYQYRKTSRWLYILRISKPNTLINIIPLLLPNKLYSWAISLVCKHVISKPVVLY